MKVGTDSGWFLIPFLLFAIYSSLLIHEIGHMVVPLLFGAHIHIELYWWGGVSTASLPYVLDEPLLTIYNVGRIWGGGLAQVLYLTLLWLVFPCPFLPPLIGYFSLCWIDEGLGYVLAPIFGLGKSPFLDSLILLVPLVLFSMTTIRGGARKWIGSKAR